MKYNLAIIPGDGIGPEVMEEAIKVLNKIGEKYNHEFEFEEVLLGGVSIDKYGQPLTHQELEKARSSDSILLGAVGADASTSEWYKLPPHLRPEAGLLKIRKELGLYANMRPAILYDELREASPLKDKIIEGGFDIVIMRELTGGLYFGDRESKFVDGVRVAYDTMIYNEEEVRRIAEWGFEIARKRDKRLTNVDKANVLDSSRLWRDVVEEVGKDYPDVTLDHMLVDNCAMQLVRNPKQFDVILTENTFGDILSDEASMIAGSIGMLPSASLADDNIGLYEPSGGSAPDIAGQNKANPIAMILSAALMLRYSFDLEEEAQSIESAVKNVLKKGYRTIDIMSKGQILVTTKEMGNYILQEI